MILLFIFLVIMNSRLSEIQRIAIFLALNVEVVSRKHLSCVTHNICDSISIVTLVFHPVVRGISLLFV